MLKPMPDLSGLEALARNQNLDVGPVLLRVQTDLFAAAPSRDRATVDAFEALALGFLDLVDDDTAVIVARKLAPLADAPARILDRLLARGGPVRAAVIESLPALPPVLAATVLADEPDLGPALAGRADLDPVTLVELAGRADDAVDLAIARNPTPIPGRALEQLVGRARGRAQLAEALLAREDLGLPDEAALYACADTRRRRTIRERLNDHAAVAALRLAVSRRADAQTRSDLVARALAHDKAGFRAVLAEALGATSPPAAWRFGAEAQRELVALALVAAGVPSDEAIRIFLTIDRAVAGSVAAVFHLAAIVRHTPQPVALYLTQLNLVPRPGRARARHVPALDPSGAPGRKTGQAHAPAPAGAAAELRTDLRMGAKIAR